MNIGSVALYNGSQPEFHGVLCEVIAIPEDRDGRGYTLKTLEPAGRFDSGETLFNVHRNSFVV